MASEWIDTTIGEAFAVNPSRTLKRGRVAPFIPMDALPIHARSVERVDSREFTGSGTRFKNGDTLIARITPCLENGKTAFVCGLPEGVVAQGSTEYIVLAGKPQHSDGLFGYYLARSPDFRRYAIGHMEGTSGRQRVPATAVEKYPFALPPISEQRAIAHILGTLDDKIELNRRRNQTLEDMARALFKDWFVDFGPVRAKMEGREPYLPEEIWRLFPERLVDSDLGEIPEEWAVTTLSEFASLNPEAWTKRTRPEKILYIDLSNTKWGRIESVTNYDADDAPSRAQRILRPLDTIVGTVRPGNGSYALISDEGLTGSTGFAVLRPLRRECSEFVYLAATARENIERLSNLADGGAYPAVRPEIVSATPVPRADEKLINEFSRQVCSMLAGIADNERESRTLVALRDTLLPKLISGDLRVPEALMQVDAAIT